MIFYLGNCLLPIGPQKFSAHPNHEKKMQATNKKKIFIIFKEVWTKCDHQAGNVKKCESNGEQKDQKSLLWVSPTKKILKTKLKRANEELILVVIAGIILQHRRSSCCLVQKIISVILYAGHSSKQVW